MGSFTTPPCTEIVQWIVLRDAVKLTPIQIEQIEDFSGIDSSFRTPQPLHGRVVQDGSEIITTKIT